MVETAKDALAGGETRRALRRLIAATEAVDRPTVGHMVDALGRSGHGLILLLLALPSFIPIPGLPTGLVFGVALMLVAVQMIRRQETVALPNWIRRQVLPRSAMLAIVGKLETWMQKLERLLRPRLQTLTEGAAMTIVGLLVLVMGVTLLLPVPFGNQGPAFAVIVFAFGIMEKDGLAIIAGAVLAAIGFAWNIALVIFGVAITEWLWNLF
ncbi:MAG: exopolysaccharide biosynthesis protein [Beijerinckiaceae bacterium]|nr:exopolysaccharide biosynthesis protein [Beijerinckiaceae bacterium]